jgi:lipopolysaccharide/colanic/teichoic acid biosynthesis glycosyltransferase
MRPSGDSNGSAITSFNDQRVFPFGGLLRKYKIDELPQLINVLKGDMAVVGPRPEDVGIVEAHYTPRDLETLNVRPGLTSPGTIYYYTDLERSLADDGSETAYVERVLPRKLAIDHVYLERQSLWYDIRIIFRTAIAIITITLGRSVSLRPPELDCIDDDDIDSGTCSRRN